MDKEERGGNRPYLRDRLEWNWNQRGRSVPRGESAAGLRFRAYRQKMAMRAQRAAASTICVVPAHPRKGRDEWGTRFNVGFGINTVWAPLGPAPLASDATGDGMQDYNWVSGRATSVVIDPGGQHWKHGAAGRRLWRSLEIDERGQSEFQSCFGHLAGFD